MASDKDNAEFRKERMFEHLAESGQWERLLEMGPEILGSDPDNDRVHALMGLGALETEDLTAAKRHVDACIRLDPEIPFYRVIEARYFRKIGRLLYAKNSLLEALRLDPTDCDVWIEFGWNNFHRGDVHTAREACEQARAMNPESIELENLATAVASESDNAERMDAWEQIEAMENSLRLEPENAYTMYNIGVTYLSDLDDGKNAQEWFRRAVAINPQEKVFRQSLLKATRRCDPVLRILNWPVHLALRSQRCFENTFHQKLWLFILLVPITFVLGIGLMCLLAMWSVFLYLPGKMYEWMTHSEAVQKAGEGTALKEGIYRVPLLLRLLLALVVSAGFVWGVWWFFTNPAADDYHDLVIGGGMIIAMVVGIWWSANRRE